ncbi:hypothetical protein N9996_02425 [Synechococcus sp. AH-603-M21]|nr:hypothetical protein [Synechococcus sp. AH-603-M21]
MAAVAFTPTAPLSRGIRGGNGLGRSLLLGLPPALVPKPAFNPFRRLPFTQEAQAAPGTSLLQLF